MKRRTLLASTGLVAAAACARIPTAGPVVPVAPSSQRPVDAGVAIAPQPPVVGGNPEVILAGFLIAMTSDRPGYPVARQYLTREASSDWRPESGAVIYDSDNHKPVTTEESASLNAPLVGSLDDRGRHTPENSTYKHDFAMTRVGGQWRIGRPPEGLLLARYLFQRYFTPITLYFLSSDGAKLAHEVIHVPEAAATPASAVEGLLAGPSPWIRPAVGTAIPTDSRSGSVATVTIGQGGVADVSFTQAVSALSDRQRLQVAAQLMWTLDQFPAVNGMRITVNGQPWAVPGTDVGSVIHPSDVAAFTPLDTRTWANLYAVRGNVVGRFEERSGGEFVTLESSFGTQDWGDDIATMGISRDESRLAVVTRDGARLWVGEVGVGEPVMIYEGTDLRRPQVSADGTVWSVGAAGAGNVLIRVPRRGRAQAVPITGLPPGAITAFRISPDLTRLVAVISQGQSTALGMVRLRDHGEDVRPEGWLPLPLHATHGVLSSIRDVAWSEAGWLLVVGASEADPHFAVYRCTADGSTVDGLGPTDTDVDVWTMTALPRVVGTTAVLVAADQSVWRYEDRFRWQRIESGYQVAVLPG